MIGREVRVGTLVVNTDCPDWGPGTIIAIHGGKLHLFFRDLRDQEKAKVFNKNAAMLEIAPDQHDEDLADLPQTVERDGYYYLPAQRLTREQAIKKFRDHFPKGFDDLAYWGDDHSGERQYKLNAHDALVKEIGDGKLRQLLADDVPELAQRVLRCIGKVNLLYLVEAAAFRDALQDVPAARRFFATLADLLDAGEITKAVFEPYAESVNALPAARGRVASWPVATILPFLLQPDRHMFLKPKITEEAAARLSFNLDYRPEPNWITYENLLRMAHRYLRALKPLAKRHIDMIDVQSFFWVTQET